MYKKSVKNFIVALLCSVFLLATGPKTIAQEDLQQHWDGVWIVDNTLFSIAVKVENKEMKLSQIESLGFEWTNQNGKVDGNIVTVEVEYAGVTGIIQAQLIDARTAIAFAATCLPDFMVVCMLSKNRQTTFRKVSAD